MAVLVLVVVHVAAVLNVVSDVDAADTALVLGTVVMAVVDSEVVEVDVIVDVFVVVMTAVMEVVVVEVGVVVDVMAVEVAVVVAPDVLFVVGGC